MAKNLAVRLYDELAADALYGKVYFPVRSNRLKDIGRWLGVSWPTAEASGIDSLVWRHRWDESHDNADKQLLLAYNEADCQALRVLADELTRLRDTGAEDPSVDSSTRPKQYATDAGGRLHREFETILRSAHAEYEHTKISRCGISRQLLTIIRGRLADSQDTPVTTTRHPRPPGRRPRLASLARRQTRGVRRLRAERRTAHHIAGRRLGHPRAS